MDTTVSLDLSKLTKAELLIKCDEIGLTKVKSKTKPELIALLSAKNIVINDFMPELIELIKQDE